MQSDWSFRMHISKYLPSLFLLVLLMPRRQSGSINEMRQEKMKNFDDCTVCYKHNKRSLPVYTNTSVVE